MDLVDRYLQAVKTWLPARQREDIIAELREDIRSEIEDKESGLGRPLSEAELEDVVRRRGRPIVAAGRFRTQGSLIGPTLFPIYLLVLRIAAIPFVMIWVGQFVLHLPQVLDSPATSLGHLSSEFWTSLVAAFGAVTLVFAVLERVQGQSRFLENWNPRSLEPVRAEKRVSRTSAVTEFALQVAFLLWWIRPAAFLNGVSWSAGHTWDRLHGTFFLPVLIMMLVTAALALAQFLHPRETTLRSWIRAATHWGAAVIAAIVLADGWKTVTAEWHWLERVRGTAAAGAETAFTDVAIYALVSWVAIGATIAFAIEMFRILRSRRGEGSGLKSVSPNTEALCI